MEEFRLKIWDSLELSRSIRLSRGIAAAALQIAK